MVVRTQATPGVATLFAVALCDRNCLAVAAIKTIRWLKHTASGEVAALHFSASEIVNATTLYYCAVSLLHICLFLREKMCWWLALAKKKMKFWIASFGDPYDSDVLQLAKQLFFSVLHK